MENAELMQKEIENKRKLPKEVKDDIKKLVFYNFLIAIIIVLYLCTINILFYKLDSTEFENKMKLFALGIIIVTVGMFEISYRKESKKICMIGIELFVCSIISLYIPYIYLHTNTTFRGIVMALPLALVVYYIAKAILIYKERKFNYQNNLSDVKEIVKDTEKTSYLDEDSKKSFREKKKIEEEIKQEIKKEQEIKKKEQEARNNKISKNAKKKNKK